MVVLLASVATVFCTGPAWAYLDPGTGSMMLQLVLGGIAGAMVVGKLYWHRFQELPVFRQTEEPHPGRIMRALPQGGTDQ
jgi:hypothetical protein